MNIRTDSLFPLAILAMLAGMTVWLERASQADDPRADGRHRHDPDFIVERFHVRRLDAAGTLRNSMSAAKMVHYPDDDSTELAAPALTYHARTPVSHVTARRGTVGKDAEVVVLEDDVVAWREATREAPQIRFTTTQLTVFPDDETARTDRPVRIVQGRSVITGTGLDIDNRSGITVLRSNVRASIDRNQNKKQPP